MALDKSWEEIFDTICEVAKSLKTSPTDKDVYGKILSKYKTIPIFHIKNSKKKRFLVKEINYQGIFVCRVANHLVTCKDGNYYDTFDCGDKALYKCWKIE